MARPVRGCLTPWPQKGGTKEHEKNISVPQQEGQTDTAEGEKGADNNLDMNYEPDGSDPDIKAVNKEEENSDAEYAKMELH